MSNTVTTNTTTLTPYAVAKLVNAALQAAGIDKSVPPQMLYTYAKKGMLGNAKGTKIITQAQADEWVEKYVAKFAK